MPPRGRPRKEGACGTCRTRRVKCDEAKPACRRCTSTGRECDGYTPIVLNRISSQPFSSSMEAHSFRYFYEKTSLELTSHYDEAFWQSFVLRLCANDLGLKHLVVAVGSFHESLKRVPCTPHGSPLSTIESSFALKQCNKAISFLKQQGFEGSGTGVLMASCLLFMALEMLQSRLDPALIHFKICMGFLEHWKEQRSQGVTSSEEQDLIENHLCPILDRFAESSGYKPVIKNEAIEMAENNQEHDSLVPTLPTMFIKLGQARGSLHIMLEYLFSSLKAMSAEADHQRSQFYTQNKPMLDVWHSRFRHFVDNSRKDVNSSHKRVIHLLEIQYLIGKMGFTACVFNNELVYDEHVGDFNRVVELCTNILKIENGRNFAGQASTMSFSFDVGILMPLYFTAWKCREPRVRRQALDLLQNCPRQEGMWFSWLTGMVAEHVISVEEAGLTVTNCKDIPVTKRIQITHLYYDPCPTGSEDHSIVYHPIVQIFWVNLNANSIPTSKDHHKTIELPSTKDNRTGKRPYWVSMPTGLDISHWKMLLARKIFDKPYDLDKVTENTKETS